MEKNASLRTVIGQSQRGEELFKENERNILNSFTSRNERRNQWIANPTTVPEFAWANALKSADVTAGPDSFFCILQALSPFLAARLNAQYAKTDKELREEINSRYAKTYRELREEIQKLSEEIQELRGALETELDLREKHQVNAKRIGIIGPILVVLLSAAVYPTLQSWSSSWW